MNSFLSVVVSEVKTLLHVNNYKTDCWYKEINIMDFLNTTIEQSSGEILGQLYFVSKPNYRNIYSNNFMDYLDDFSIVYNPKTLVLIDFDRIKKISNDNYVDFKSMLFYITLHEYCHYQDIYSKHSLQYLNYDKYVNEIERRTNDMTIQLFKKTKYYSDGLLDFLEVA